MKITKMPEDGKKFIDYSIRKDTIDFGDGELTMKLSKKERDDATTIDVVQDYTGGLITSTAGGERYLAQIYIPAREYTEKEVPNPNYPGGEGSNEPETITEREPVPFSMDRCELRLWEMEV